MANTDKLSLIELAVANADCAFAARRRGKHDQEKALLEAALVLARKSRRAPNLSQFLQDQLSGTGEQSRRRSAVVGSNRAVGMVGCGTIEMMYRAQIKDALRGYNGVVGIEFVGTSLIRVRVKTEEDGKQLPQEIRNRAVEWVVVGTIRKSLPR